MQNIAAICEVPPLILGHGIGHPLHPLLIRVFGDPGDVDSAGSDVRFSPPLRLYGGCRPGVRAHLTERLASSLELASQG